MSELTAVLPVSLSKKHKLLTDLGTRRREQSPGREGQPVSDPPVVTVRAEPGPSALIAAAGLSALDERLLAFRAAPPPDQFAGILLSQELFREAWAIHGDHEITQTR